ncbi:MAG: Maf family protein [Halanaerobiales bacterium]
MNYNKIVLASSSPRRKELLNQLGLDFTIIPGNINEEKYINFSPENTVVSLAQAKVKDAAGLVEDTVIIGADTIVVYEDEIIGKPENEKEAKKILLKLSGNKHEVYTGLAVMSTFEDKVLVECDVTEVYMRKLSKEQINNYIKSGEPLDKAGSYGIQGIGGILVEEIRGSFYTVVGLPIHKLALMLDEFSINIL